MTDLDATILRLDADLHRACLMQARLFPAPGFRNKGPDERTGPDDDIYDEETMEWVRPALGHRVGDSIVRIPV